MKTIVRLWLGLGGSVSLSARLTRTILLALLAYGAYQCITVHFDWQQQGLLGAMTILLAVLVSRGSKSDATTMVLIIASSLVTIRYAVWRFCTVLQAVRDPSQKLGIGDLFFMVLLLGAETYAFVILFLGHIQTIRPLRRPPIPLPDDAGEWPDVDVLIPTYNEPLAVVRSTAFAALNMDYPAEKLHVHLLDDGRREEFRSFAEQLGIGYVMRSDNRHAKAGNINRALERLTAPLVAIFDCDHVPTRSFLQVTAGWFLKDARLGMLQTPHHFYSPDPFERNLGCYQAVPNEGELFYGLLQDGNDLWNATFFCGSCAVLRRTALEEIGGIAVETVTEDAHTSLRMQTRGWNTAYINLPQAAGLATESLSAHIGQRIRWARGMIQILRIDNPLLVRGLKWPQRICYLNAMLHFLYAVPRLVFLTAPLVYMLFGMRNLPGHWLSIAAYGMPHLVLSRITNSRIQGKFRHSFWNEVYETVLAPYILGPTLLALLNPKLGKFNVTAKGGIVEDRYFDKRIARPYLVLLWLNYLALAVAPWRLLARDANHRGAVLMNVVWILFNCVIIGTANAVALESQQRRSSVRLNARIALKVQLPDGRLVDGYSKNLSLGGGAAVHQEMLDIRHGTAVCIFYSLPAREVSLPAIIVNARRNSFRFKYEELSLEQEESLTLVLYSRADAWLHPDERWSVDRPLRSLALICRLSLRGLAHAFPRRSSPRRAVLVPEAASASAATP
jgi:cellulose synthase (UDP-forming)